MKAKLEEEGEGQKKKKRKTKLDDRNEDGDAWGRILWDHMNEGFKVKPVSYT